MNNQHQSKKDLPLQQAKQQTLTNPAEILRKADLYDLIKLSLKASNNKISAMDRYIQRALERQVNGIERGYSPDRMIQDDGIDNDDVYSVQQQTPDISDLTSQKQQQQQKENNRRDKRRVSFDTEHTEVLQKEDSPIKENIIQQQWVIGSIQSSIEKQRNSQQVVEIQKQPVYHQSQRHSPQREPFTDSANQSQAIGNFIEMVQRTPEKNDRLRLIKLQSSPQILESSPIREDNHIQVLQQTFENVLSSQEHLQSEGSNYKFLKMVPVEESCPSPKRELPPLPEETAMKIAEQTIDSAFQSVNDLQQTQEVQFPHSQTQDDYFTKQEQLHQDFEEAQKTIQNCSQIVEKQSTYTPTRRDNSNQSRTIETAYFSKLNQAYNTTRTINGQNLNQTRSNKEMNESTQQPQYSHRDRSKSGLKRDTSQHKLNNVTPNKMLQQKPKQQPSVNLEEYDSRSVYKASFKAQQNIQDEKAQLPKLAQQILKKSLSKKQKLMNAFKEINLQVFVELGRIKKPQKHAFLAGKMLCQMVNVFREKPLIEEFNQWPAIQMFINHNVNRFTQEVLMLKNRLVENKDDINHEELRNLKELFFDDPHFQTFYNQVTDKNLKLIINLVYEVIHFVCGKKQAVQNVNEDVSSQGGDTNHTEPSAHQQSYSQTNDETPRSHKAYSPFNNVNHGKTIFGQQSSSSVRQHNFKLNFNQSNISPINANNYGSTTSPINSKTPKYSNLQSKQHLQDSDSKKHNFNQKSCKDLVAFNFAGAKDRTPTRGQQQVKNGLNKSISTRHLQDTSVDLYQSRRAIGENLNKRFDVSNNNRKSIVPSTVQNMSKNAPSKSPINYKGLSSKSPMRMDFSKTPVTHRPVMVEKPKVQLTTHQNNDSSKKSQKTLLTSSRLQYSEKKQEDKPQISQKQQYESPEISPQKIRDEYPEARSHISEVIIAKSYQIEENMRNEMQSVCSTKNIDLGIIEELKRRRQLQRVTGEDLEQKRDAIIIQIQKSIFHE